jgi:hypothetical protein
MSEETKDEKQEAKIEVPEEHKEKVTSFKINQDFIKKQVELQENLIRCLSPSMELIKSISPSLNIINDIANSPAIKSLALMQENLQKTYGNMFQGISNLILNLDLPNISQNLEKIKKLEKEYPWMESLLDFWEIGTAFKLGEALDETTREKFWEEIYNSSKEINFEDNFYNLLKQFSIKEDRKKIITEGYNNHKEGNFISSVSILSPQIEGIIWDIGVNKKLVEDKENSNNILAIDGKVIERLKGNKEAKWDLDSLLGHLFDKGENSRNFIYANQNEESFYKKIRSPIAHGRKTDFNTKENSSICILLILVILIKFMEEKDDTTKTK